MTGNANGISPIFPGLLREERYDELDERCSRRCGGELLRSREAEKAPLLRTESIRQPFYDMDTLVEAGPQGLALIKTGCALVPAPLRGLPRRNTGITVRGFTAAMAGREKPPSDVDLRRLQRTDGHRAVRYRL